MKKPNSTLFSEMTFSFVVTLAGMALCLVGLIMLSGFRNHANKPKGAGHIPNEVVNDICIKLSISKEQICKNKTDVYPPDFYPAISKAFIEKVTTYNEVQLILGNYQVKLESPQKIDSGEINFTSRYDLNGDGESDISFFFNGNYETNYLENIISTYGIGF